MRSSSKPLDAIAVHGRASISDKDGPRAFDPHGILWISAGAAWLLAMLLRNSTWDLALFHLANDWGPRWPVVWSWLSMSGLGVVALIVAGIWGMSNPLRLAQVTLILILGGMGVQLLKLIFGEARPAGLLGADGLHVIGIVLRAHSMPSGHAAMAAALAVLAVHAAAPWARQHGVHRAIVASSILVALAVALSRVAVGAHWPSDVFAGAALGIAMATMVIKVPLLKGWSQRGARALVTSAGSRVVAAALVTAACALWVAERDYPLAEGMPQAMGALALWAAWRWWRRDARRHDANPLPSRVVG